MHPRGPRIFERGMAHVLSHRTTELLALGTTAFRVDATIKIPFTGRTMTMTRSGRGTVMWFTRKSMQHLTASSFPLPMQRYTRRSFLAQDVPRQSFRPEFAESFICAKKRITPVATPPPQRCSPPVEFRVKHWKPLTVWPTTGRSDLEASFRTTRRTRTTSSGVAPLRANRMSHRSPPARSPGRRPARSARTAIRPGWRTAPSCAQAAAWTAGPAR